MIGIVCANLVRPLKAPGARATGRRASSAIFGTLPERRASLSASTIGSTRRPCARAPCSTFSYLLTPHPLQPRPNAVRTSAAIGSCATSSFILVCGAISISGMASWLNLRTAPEYARVDRARARGARRRLRFAGTLGLERRLADVRASFGRRRVRLRRIGAAVHRLHHGLRAAAL